MKAIAVLLVLTGGGMAVGQTSAPAPKTPALLFTMPTGPQLRVPGEDLRFGNGMGSGLGMGTVQKFEPGPGFTLPQGPMSQWSAIPRVVLPSKAVGMDRDVDKGMVVHPPREKFAEHAGRTPMASRLYPKLKILPTEEGKLEALKSEPLNLERFEPESLGLESFQLDAKQARLEIPAAPAAGKFKVEPIPTTAPKSKLEPIPTTWQGFEMVPVTDAKK